MAATNRSDIAIETAEAIDFLIFAEVEHHSSPNEVHPETVGLERARHVIATFISATRVSQGPRAGRPRKPKAEG